MIILQNQKSSRCCSEVQDDVIPVCGQLCGAGLDELPYFMPDLGGTAEIQIATTNAVYAENMPAKQYCGLGPISLRIVFCLSQDGEGKTATHWELGQSWVDPKDVSFCFVSFR